MYGDNGPHSSAVHSTVQALRSVSVCPFIRFDVWYGISRSFVLMQENRNKAIMCILCAVLPRLPIHIEIYVSLYICETKIR